MHAWYLSITHQKIFISHILINHTIHRPTSLCIDGIAVDTTKTTTHPSGQTHKIEFISPVHLKMDDKAHSHINPKTQSARANLHLWRDSLRKECMKRAKTARRELLLHKRRGCSVNGDCLISFPENRAYIKLHHECEVKREVIDSYNDRQECYEWPDEINSDHPTERDNAVKLFARSLVEREIQKSMIGLDHCHLQYGSSSIDNIMDTTNSEAKLISWSEDTQEIESQKHLDSLRKQEGKEAISGHDFMSLLNDVTEELQKEGTISIGILI